MFKTVKVGDTSLQYTIVSQTEDSSSSNGGGGGNVIRKNKIKRRTRHRQTVILILITLIMGCGIVIAAVLVPILVASKLVGNLPESAKFQTFAIAASSIQGYGKHDQNGHKYVELLPIKRAPVDSMIEFKEEIPIVENSDKWPTDFRLNFNDNSKQPTSQKQSTGHDRQSISNSSQVTVYYNKTENTTRFSSLDSSIKSKTSYWNDVVRFLKTLIDLSIQRLTTVIQFLCFTLIVITVVVVIRLKKRKRRPKKVESNEHKAQRKQLLAAIPIEDD